MNDLHTPAIGDYIRFMPEPASHYMLGLVVDLQPSDLDTIVHVRRFSQGGCLSSYYYFRLAYARSVALTKHRPHSAENKI